MSACDSIGLTWPEALAVVAVVSFAFGLVFLAVKLVTRGFDS